MKYRYTRTAVANLEAIRDYIARHNPAAAGEQVERIRRAVLQVTKTPYIGQPDTIPGTRRLVRRPYLIRYTVVGDTVTILTIRHGRQRPD